MWPLALHDTQSWLWSLDTSAKCSVSYVQGLDHTRSWAGKQAQRVFQTLELMGTALEVSVHSLVHT